jgi:Flp pilus assembly pilin Flp
VLATLRRLLAARSAASTAEYAILVTGVVAGVVVAGSIFSTGLLAIFEQLATQLVDTFSTL